MREQEKLLEKAVATLEDARTALDQEMTLPTVQNRVYYSIFYAAKAALVSRGNDVGTHQGVKVQIGQDLIKENLLEETWGRFFSRQQTYREQADYELDIDLNRKDLEKFLGKAEEFIEEMREIAEEN